MPSSCCYNDRDDDYLQRQRNGRHRFETFHYRELLSRGARLIRFKIKISTSVSLRVLPRVTTLARRLQRRHHNNINNSINNNDHNHNNIIIAIIDNTILYYYKNRVHAEADRARPTFYFTITIFSVSSAAVYSPGCRRGFRWVGGR